MSRQCSYIDRTKSPNVPCGYLAQDGSKYQYCPRHELLVPALEAEQARKSAIKQKVAARKRRTKAVR